MPFKLPSLRFSILLFQLVSCSPVHSDLPLRRSSTTNYTNSISDCPSLTPRRSPATSVNDLRPDDFSYALALGDSITAGAFSHGIQSDNIALSYSEWRGDSFAAGENPGSITVPNLIKHYSSSLAGGSLGSNPSLELCFGPACPTGTSGWNSTVDQLNAAQSGAISSNLLHEVNDYLIPQIRAKNVPTRAFKYLNLHIGSNDLCLVCNQTISGVSLESPDVFEANIRSVLKAIRAAIPNTVVNILGLFKTTDVYLLTRNQPYCANVLPMSHNATVTCQCMFLNSADGDAARASIDALRDEYNNRLIKIATEYQAIHCSDFAVLWQPPNIPLSTYPVEALSNVDCFHPSLKSHQLIASQVWNLLVGNATEREQTFTWTDSPSFRCLSDGDRIQTSALLSS